MVAEGSERGRSGSSLDPGEPPGDRAHSFTRQPAEVHAAYLRSAGQRAGARTPEHRTVRTRRRHREHVVEPEAHRLPAQPLPQLTEELIRKLQNTLVSGQNA